MSERKTTIYEYPKCSTCKAALKFLDGLDIPYKKIDISENPPSKKELIKMLGYCGGELRRLFNTSGMQYRELGMSSKIEKISVDEALNLLVVNGKLVKRPFLLTENGGLVGFKKDEWRSLLEK